MINKLNFLIMLNFLLLFTNKELKGKKSKHHHAALSHHKETKLFSHCFSGERNWDVSLELMKLSSISFLQLPSQLNPLLLPQSRGPASPRGASGARCRAPAPPPPAPGPRPARPPARRSLRPPPSRGRAEPSREEDGTRGRAGPAAAAVAGAGARGRPASRGRPEGAKRRCGR